MQLKVYVYCVRKMVTMWISALYFSSRYSNLLHSV